MFARFRPYIGTALLATLIFYFGVNALTGERGLLRGARRESTLADKVKTLKQLRAQRETLETEVRLLSNDNLSRDLLEEEARRMLGFAAPSDYVIRNP